MSFFLGGEGTLVGIDVTESNYQSHSLLLVSVERNWTTGCSSTNVATHPPKSIPFFGGKRQGAAGCSTFCATKSSSLKAHLCHQPWIEPTSFRLPLKELGYGLVAELRCVSL